LARRESNH